MDESMMNDSLHKVPASPDIMPIYGQINYTHLFSLYSNCYELYCLDKNKVFLYIFIIGCSLNLFSAFIRSDYAEKKMSEFLKENAIYEKVKTLTENDWNEPKKGVHTNEIKHNKRSWN